MPARRPKRETPKPISRATSRANRGVRYATGMDVVRRPAKTKLAQTPSPREVLERMQAAAAEQPPQAAVAVASTMSAPLALPRTPIAARFDWKRPVIAFSLVALALVSSGLAVRAVTSPRTSTASADASQPSQGKASAVSPHKAGLQKLLNDFVSSNPDKFGIVVKNLKTGETATYASDRQIESASLYKLFVAQRIYQRIDLGQLGYGSPAGGGMDSNVEQCLAVMINISDNDCGRALGDILGWGSQNQALALEGYKETDMATPQQTSAGDVARLFERLYRGTLVSPDSASRFLSLLKDQQVNNRLPVGLPPGAVIAHKTGDLDGVVHDAGIVYGPKTDYLVVVTSGPWDAPGNAPAMFADFSHSLWSYFEQ
jgi:beta-lactamase class A